MSPFGGSALDSGAGDSSVMGDDAMFEEELVDPKAREADRITIQSWPKPGTFRVWRMNSVR